MHCKSSGANVLDGLRGDKINSKSSVLCKLSLYAVILTLVSLEPCFNGYSAPKKTDFVFCP